MKRRALLLACLLCLGAAPLTLDAQPARVSRIGVISGDFPNNAPCLEALQRGLVELGYVEGRTHVLDVRWSEGRVESFPGLAADLVRQKVDLIVSTAGPAAPQSRDRQGPWPEAPAAAPAPGRQADPVKQLGR